ncbi:hypothetical protein [Spirillospora sp. CA-128828]|uniref:hypothetical protein n=1 Tax=Spirillospora sp. CA-128828 TaxID=3240033 RepID=UPI003D91C2E7
MPGKHTRAAIKELEEAGWKITYTSGRAHTYARASCPGGPGCRAPPFSINGTPDVDEHEAQKIRRRMRQHDAKVAALHEGED